MINPLRRLLRSWAKSGQNNGPDRNSLAALAFVLMIASISSAQDLKPLSTNIASHLSTLNRKSVAVVDFTDLQGNVTELGRYIAEELSVAMTSDAKGFDLIDRSSLNVIMREHNLAEKGIIDPSVARKLGQIAGVDTLITGTLTPIGDNVHVTVKALDTQTARMLGGFSIDIPKTKTIDELLNRGIVGGEYASDGSSEDSVQGSVRRTATFQLGDFMFLIQGCRLGDQAGNEDQLICWGIVTNKGSQLESVSISTDSYFVDNLGHRAGINWMSIGGASGAPVEGHPGVSLEPNLPLQFWIDARGFDKGISSTTFIFSANGHRITLRDIRLQGR